MTISHCIVIHPYTGLDCRTTTTASVAAFIIQFNNKQQQLKRQKAKTFVRFTIIVTRETKFRLNKIFSKCLIFSSVNLISAESIF